MKKILLILILFSTSLHAQVDTSLMTIKSFTIHSKILETERNYWVSLPTNYDSTRTYPVMYILDAEWKFSITNTLEKDLSGNGKIPQHIVVGITHPNRRLDLSFSTTKVNYKGEIDTTSFQAENTGNGLKFLTFIEEELIEEIKQKYSTSGFNILIGHSLGGYFCSYVLPIQHSFQALQIYDPSIWYSEGEAITQIESKLTEDKRCTIFLASSGNFENHFNYHHLKIEELNQTLKCFSNIRIEYIDYADENHNSMYLHSFLDGMAILYQGYELKTGGLETNITAAQVTKHFKQFSKTIHFEFKAENELYLTVGITNFHQKKYTDCIEALEIYLDKNEKNPYAFELIGDAYALVGRKKESRNAYQRAFALSPENKRLKGKIQ